MTVHLGADLDPLRLALDVVLMIAQEKANFDIGVHVYFTNKNFEPLAEIRGGKAFPVEPTALGVNNPGVAAEK